MRMSTQPSHHLGIWPPWLFQGGNHRINAWMQGINHQTRLKKALVDDPFHQLFVSFCCFLSGLFLVSDWIMDILVAYRRWIWGNRDRILRVKNGVHHPADGSRGVHPLIIIRGPAVLDTAKKSFIPVIPVIFATKEPPGTSPYNKSGPNRRSAPQHIKPPWHLSKSDAPLIQMPYGKPTVCY